MTGGGLLTVVPWRDDANLGRAYNEAMTLVPEGGWAAFLDHDAIPTTAAWNRQLREAIDFLPDAGAFVAMTNRIASSWQRTGDPKSDDYALHRRIGAERARVRTLLRITETKGFGGVLFAVSKTAWREAGGFADGLGCVDHSMHFGIRRAGREVWLVEGLYVYHWRHKGEPDPTMTHPKAPGCPCRGEEPMPRHRVTLPDR